MEGQEDDTADLQVQRGLQKTVWISKKPLTGDLQVQTALENCINLQRGL